MVQIINTKSITENYVRRSLLLSCSSFNVVIEKKVHASCIHVWRIWPCFVISMLGGCISQVLNVALVSEARSSSIKIYDEGLAAAIV